MATIGASIQGRCRPTFFRGDILLFRSIDRKTRRAAARPAAGHAGGPVRGALAGAGYGGGPDLRDCPSRPVHALATLHARRPAPVGAGPACSDRGTGDGGHLPQGLDGRALDHDAGRHRRRQGAAVRRTRATAVLHAGTGLPGRVAGTDRGSAGGSDRQVALGGASVRLWGAATGAGGDGAAASRTGSRGRPRGGRLRL